MAGDLQISIACTDTDRTRAMIDGQVRIEGCCATFLTLEPAEIFFRALRFQEFDVAELSLSSFMRTIDAGNAAYVGIPVFLSRLFRHSSFYIRTDRGISSPSDLAGRTLGIAEYQMTAAVWMRALLQHDYGVPPSAIRWKTGGQEEPGRDERTRLTSIPGVSIEPIGPTQTLSTMLASGEIDGMLTARTPSCYVNGLPHVDRLFPDYKSVEHAYFKRTGLFPIMHLVGVRKELVSRHPWLPASLYKAFCKTRETAMKRLRQVRFLPLALPWIETEAMDAIRLMGSDYWKYGVTGNEAELKSFTQYSFEQGLTSRLIDASELFAESTLETSRV